jgi:hypothetical protein
MTSVKKISIIIFFFLFESMPFAQNAITLKDTINIYFEKIKKQLKKKRNYGIKIYTGQFFWLILLQGKHMQTFRIRWVY